MNLNVVVRDFKREDYKDIVKAGYSFPDLNELRPAYEYEGLISRICGTISFEKKKIFVAYSLTDKKAVGKITLRKINENMWGVWHIFVSPTHRRRGIGSLLYDISFEYLRNKGIKKAVGSVAINNMPSVESIKKTWDGFLSQRFYYYSGKMLQMQRWKSRDIIVRRYHRQDRKRLFQVYKTCCHEDWITFLEIDEGNFLDRFINPLPTRGLLWLLFKKRILVAERKGIVHGYAIILGARFLRGRPTVFLFLPPQVSREVGQSLMFEAFRDSLVKNTEDINIYHVMAGEPLLDRILPEASSERQIHLVPIRELQI